MAPLEDLPVNTALRNGRPSPSSGPELDEPMAELLAKNVRDSIPPSSIQSMLRLTTETGELGEFSIRPSRVQRSTTKSSLQRSDSHLSAEGWAQQHRIISPRSRRHHGPPDRRPNPGLRRQNTSGSGFTSYHSHSRGPSQVSTQNLRNLERMTNRVPVPPDLLHHKSIGSLRNQQPRPRSPYAYPTRLRRPGYRSPSPSISDRPNIAYRPNGSSIRTNSPSSMYSQRRVPPGYYSGFNQSAASLPGFSPPALPPGHPGINPSPLPSRVGTPVSHRAPTPLVSRVHTPVPSPSSNISLTSHNAATLRLGGSVAGSVRSTSPSPLYYDYTESFYEDERPYHQQNASSLSLPLSTVNQIIPENGAFATPQTEIPAPRARPAEPPIPPLRKSSEKFLPRQRQELPHVVSQNFTQQQQRPTFTSTVETEPAAEEYSTKEVVNGEHLQVISQDDRSRKLSRSLTSRSSSSYHLSLLSSSRRKRDLNNLSSRVDSISSSILGEPVDRDSSQRVSLMWPKPTNTVGAPDHSAISWKLPSLNFSRLTLSSGSEYTDERTRSSRGVQEGQHCEILAPTPERLASSQSHHHRFSKILSIDETFTELPETLTVFDVSGRSLMPTGVADAPDGYVKPMRKRESFHFPRPPMPKQRLKGATSLPTFSQRRNEPLPFDAGKFVHARKPQTSAEEVNKHAEPNVRDAVELDSKEIHPEPENQPIEEKGLCDGNATLDASAVTFALEVPTDLSPTADVPDEDIDASLDLNNSKALPLLLGLEEQSPPERIISTQTPSSQIDLDPSHLVTPRRPPAILHRRSTTIIRNQEYLQNEADAESGGFQKFKVKLRSGREAALSPPGSRPWNVDENYPWMDVQEVLETPPESSLNTQEEKKDDKLSLAAKIKRRFSSPRQTSRFITKRLSISSNVSCLDGVSRITGELTESPRPPALPEISEILANPMRPVNSSRAASIRASQISGTFSISMPPSLLGQRLPSPTLPFTDVRSFFSDDSSQTPHRGTLRNRFSNLKGRRSGPKLSFTDGRNGNEQPVDLAAHTTERKRANTTTGHEATVGMTNFEYSRRKVVERLKEWWQRHFRFLGTKKVPD